MSQKKSRLDIIIPVKNEQGNVTSLVKRISKALNLASIRYSLIFIDDHSTDRTIKILKKLQPDYPIKIHTKKGEPGKAYSIIEGVKYSKSQYVAMIDADLQYPPEAIPAMVKMIPEYGIVVAKRSHSEESTIRKFFHNGFSFIFAKLLHGFEADVQSGLKIFKRQILKHIDVSKISPWTLDLSLLTTARDLGLKIGEVDITFDKRINGESKVNVFKTSYEIGKNTLELKFKRNRSFEIAPTKKNSAIGAGLMHKGKKFITHSALPYKLSALETIQARQVFPILWTILIILMGLIINPLVTVIGVVAVLSLIYFIDVLFNVYVVLKSLHFPAEISYKKSQLEAIKSKDLPIYSILCPLYKEANVLPHFLNSIEKLDWPKSKLEVMLLLEEDDTETIIAAQSLKMPKYVKIVIVPESEPKTKPKACNYGLALAKGRYLVIYDAEDRPESTQLKKAYLAFKNLHDDVVCLQAKLNYYNPHQNLLTRFFTAEYSLWFDVILTGLQTIGTTIPLGGTSNHFATADLKALNGWDAFNVTEDCDLGVRLFKAGYKTAIIDSVTLEEANSHVGNWLRQRSRWIKGYMQTFLVHMREPREFFKDHGIHAFIFALIIGARISFMFINPFLWLMTISYFALYKFVGPQIEAIYPTPVFHIALVSLVFGNFMYIYNYMIGCLKRGQYSLIKYVYLIPFYWLLASTAAVMGLYQLIVKPYYWEKTVHGLDLKGAIKAIAN